MAITAVGIDPGLSGGIAIIRDGRIIALGPMPIIRKGREDGKDLIDAPAIAGLLTSVMPTYRGSDRWSGATVVLERVGMRPGQSAQSGMTVGRNYGMVEAAVRLIGAPLDFATPQQWHKALGVPAFPKGAGETEKKRITRAVAERLLRDERIAQLPASADGQWEAALIALHAYRKIGGSGL